MIPATIAWADGRTWGGTCPLDELPVDQLSGCYQLAVFELQFSRRLQMASPSWVVTLARVVSALPQNQGSMLEKSYNHHLMFRLAATRGEIDQLMSELPAPVQVELAAELESAGRAQRYDLGTQTAFAFELQGTVVACWTWSDVRTYDEAGRLLVAIVELGEPMNPLLACQLYTAATERPSLLDPQHMPRDGAYSPP